MPSKAVAPLAAPPLMVLGYKSPPLPILHHLNMLNNLQTSDRTLQVIMLFSALRNNQTIISSTRSSFALNNWWMWILFSLSQQWVTGHWAMAWVMVPESGVAGGSLQTQCTGISFRKFIFVFLFRADLHPVPTFDGLYFEWHPVWSDKDSNSQQLLGHNSQTGLWDTPPLERNSVT